MKIDPPTRAVADLIAALGYVVTIHETQATATDNETGERFIIRGDDPYKNIVALAEQIGIDLSSPLKKCVKKSVGWLSSLSIRPGDLQKTPGAPGESRSHSQIEFFNGLLETDKAKWKTTKL